MYVSWLDELFLDDTVEVVEEKAIWDKYVEKNLDLKDLNKEDVDRYKNTLHYAKFKLRCAVIDFINIFRDGWERKIMSAKSKYKGHEIVVNNDGEWIFESNGKLVSEDVWCKCGHCGLATTKEDHDGCLGKLIGLMNACCGHGVEDDAYIQFLDGRCIRGKDAVIIQKILKVWSNKGE